MLFMLTLISGTLICVSSSSWFTAWLGLEINLMSMIPLMLIKLSKENTETSIKYFLSQAFASLILILSVMTNFTSNEMMNLESSEFFLMTAMMIKLGAVPFHLWFPQVIELTEWPQCLILFTWQKIAPFVLLSCVMSKMLLMFSFMSALIGGISGINQTKIKLILTYSSISHLGWMMAASYLSMNFWAIYFMVYSILSFMIINSLMKSSKINFITEMNIWSTSKSTKIFFIMNMLSLGGLPPLLGFMSKLLVIKLMIQFKMIFLIVNLVLSSLISLYFYCRVIYAAMMINSDKTILNIMKSKMNPLFITLSISMNILIPLFMLL
uniref:NADH-ubiquinone oxidoreductase chain 2 n=1 Tax=Orchesella cincta TaxID=48709 RepID=A0A1L2E0Q4_ORCCI|nr:NADH dehydrogenase subunit 2 [Orchesella cincta]ANJ04213.1 NADH dehydrogenase subunit 2 [Orchesella cincta]